LISVGNYSNIEIGGQIDAIALATGTGGTLAGASNYLKEQNPNIRCVMVNTSDAGVVAANDDPPIRLRLRTAEEAKLCISSSLEGVGSGILYDNLARARIDDVVSVMVRFPFLWFSLKSNSIARMLKQLQCLIGY
jgi:cysteine synthase A